MKKIYLLSGFSLLLFVSATAQLQERLVAQVTDNDDTLTYSYPQGLGSRFNYFYMDYSVNYDPMNTASPMLLPIIDRQREVRSDTTWGNGTVMQTAQYNIAAKIVEASWGLPASQLRYFSFFDAQGNIDEMYEVRYITVPTLQIDTIRRKVFYYNTANQIIRDTLYHFQAGSVINHTYTYNALGQLVEIAKISSTGTDAYTYTYNANSQITSYIRARNGNLLEKDSLEYGGSLKRLIVYDDYYWNPTTQQWDLTNLDRRHLDANGNIDSVFYQIGTPTLELFYVLKYNGNNNPIERTSFGSNPGTTYYYYEPYFATGVGAAKAATADMRVFPNPVSGVLNITWKGATIGASVHISLLNMLGQPVYSEQLNWMQATEQVHTSHLPTGSYRLLIRDMSGAVLHQQAVVKD